MTLGSTSMHTAKHCIRTHGSIPYTPSFDARQCQLDHKLQSGQLHPFVPHHLVHQIHSPSPSTSDSSDTTNESFESWNGIEVAPEHHDPPQLPVVPPQDPPIYHYPPPPPPPSPSIPGSEPEPYPFANYDDEPRKYLFPSTPSYSSVMSISSLLSSISPIHAHYGIFYSFTLVLLYGLPDYGPFPPTSEQPLPLNDYRNILILLVFFTTTSHLCTQHTSSGCGPSSYILKLHYYYHPPSHHYF